jgi:predicted ribosome quality control (RQC) complex YloA/Tae2 family protein
MDELTLKLLLQELAPDLDGARVLAAYRPSVRALAFDVAAGERRGRLVVAPGDGGALFYTLVPEGARGERLRPGVAGATFVSARQWRDDRLLLAELESETGPRQLAVEFFGRAGGVYVLAQGVVEAVLAGRRLPRGEPYPEPADRGRRPAAEFSEGERAGLLAARDAGKLVREVAFMSPYAAAAILAGPSDDERQRRWAQFAAVASGRDVAPVAVKTGGRWRPFPCALGAEEGPETEELRRFATLNEAVAFAYGENERAEAREEARRRAERDLGGRIKRLERQREALARRAAAYGRAEAYRRMGEALKYHLAAVTRGATEVTLPDPYGGEAVVVELEPNLTPAENMERLFGLYRKARRGRRAVAARLAELEEELARLCAEREAARQASDLAELERWRRDEAPAGRAAPRRETKGPGRRFLSSDGFTVVVGRGAAENEEITFKLARPHDLWLHASQARGSHVIIRRQDKNKPVPRRTIEEAAALAAYYSRDKHAGVVPVVVVERRHVRRAKGARGRVTHRGGEVVFVEPALKLKPAGAGEP